MHTCDLINSSHLERSASTPMQVFDENSEVFCNFINTLHSDSTKESYRFCQYQRKAIEFQDLAIELWEVKGYSNNTVLFNQILAPQKSESISTLSQKSEVVRRVGQEVKVYSEQLHLDKANDNIKSIYKEIKDTILSLDMNITIRPTAKYMAFIRSTNFVDIDLYRNQLNLFLNMKKGTLNDPRNMAKDVSTVGHWGNGDYQVIVNDSSNIGYILSLIRQSYDKN